MRARIRVVSPRKTRKSVTNRRYARDEINIPPVWFGAQNDGEEETVCNYREKDVKIANILLLQAYAESVYFISRELIESSCFARVFI